MLVKAILLSLLLMVTFSHQGFGFGYAQDKYHARSVPIPAPDIKATDLTGKPLDLTPTGKPQFLVFWATYCAPCLREMPSLDKLALKKEEWDILPVSIDLGHAARNISNFYRRVNLKKLPIIWDKTSKVMAQYQVRHLPSTAVIDRHGQWIGTVEGEIDWADPRNIYYFEEILSQ